MIRRHPLPLMTGLAWAALAIGAATPAAAATDPRPSAPPDAQPRRMTITRTGYARAKPEAATVLIPYLVEADSLNEVEKQRGELLADRATLLAPFGVADSAVSFYDGRSGVAAREGRQLTTYEGTVAVEVRSLTRLREIVAALRSRHPAFVRARYSAASPAALAAAPERAQRNAIAAARHAANSLANAAGTRIVGIWELNEGEVKGIVAEWIDVPKTAQAEIPPEVDLVSACITIVYEMAPGHLPPAHNP